MTKKEFENNLLLYGPDVQLWPESERTEGLNALDSFPEMNDLVSEHDRFETLLMSRHYEEPAPGLSQRIINASLRMEKREMWSLRDFFAELFLDFSFSSPAFILFCLVNTLILITGFAIGFSNPLENMYAQVNLQEFLYYEGVFSE